MLKFKQEKIIINDEESFRHNWIISLSLGITFRYGLLSSCTLSNNLAQKITTTKI